MTAAELEQEADLGPEPDDAWGTYERAMWAIQCWREQAAERVDAFVAMGGMTMKPARAAAAMGVDERTIYRWKRRVREAANSHGDDGR